MRIAFLLFLPVYTAVAVAVGWCLCMAAAAKNGDRLLSNFPYEGREGGTEPCPTETTGGKEGEKSNGPQPDTASRPDFSA
jgi:hypothetical protein